MRRATTPDVGPKTNYYLSNTLKLVVPVVMCTHAINIFNGHACFHCVNCVLSGTNSIHFGLFGAENLPMYVKGLGWTVSCPLIPLIAKDFLSDTQSSLQGEY